MCTSGSARPGPRVGLWSRQRQKADEEEEPASYQLGAKLLTGHGG